ncbi:endonuclease exonuclease phosphatase family [Labeo rohita]|uniref:Endonuclease exonuclease phosphatase family n=1 Tax=Labeo rohita TaxID=84645 RepID=A0A498MFN3_LABRO|nr:endonuclease exonuclease phosphatase family [Labeo rohita]
MLYFSGGEKREAGVGFMVDHRTSASIIAFQPISERLAVLTIEGTVTTHVIAVYAPTETSPDTNKDDFYERLQLILDATPKTNLIVIAGDLNTHVGSERLGWEATLGRFGHGEINDNGHRLLSFAAANNMVIGNSIFQHPLKHRLTWRNPSGKDSAMLDYVLINTRFRSSLQDVRAMRGPDCGSDHYLIRARLRLKLHRAKRAAPKSPRLDWRQLANADRRQEFQLALSNRFAQLADSDGVDEEEQKIAEAIVDSARPLCPPIRRRTQLWISEECLDLVAKRKKAKLVDFERYRQLNRDIRRMMKRDREAYWDQVAHDLEEAASRHEYRTLYRTLRDLSGKSKSINDNIKKADGTFVRSTAERLQRWKEFFDGLYNHDPPQGPPVAPPVTDLPPVLMSDAEPTLEEVKLAVYALKNGKSPGLDQVAAEGIKAGGDTLLPRLHNLIKLIWRLDKVPTRWKKAIIIPIHKKGESAITIAESAFFQSSAKS